MHKCSTQNLINRRMPRDRSVLLLLEFPKITSYEFNETRANSNVLIHVVVNKITKTWMITKNKQNVYDIKLEGRCEKKIFAFNLTNNSMAFVNSSSDTTDLTIVNYHAAYICINIVLIWKWRETRKVYYLNGWIFNEITCKMLIS